MTYEVLEDVGLSLTQVSELGGNDRSRLLNFLLRWNHLDALHACLDVLLPRNPGLVSLLDLRVKALLEEARYDEARVLMRARLEQRSSLTARTLLVRIHAARGSLDEALAVARALVEESPESVTAWYALAEVELARGEVDAAAQAYQEVQTLRPGRRGYLLGMVQVYRAREDWVAASGYAVRLLRSAEEEQALSVSYLRPLRKYFQASGERTRVADLDAQLEALYAAELVELRDHFAGREAPSPEGTAPEAVAPQPVEFVPTVEQVSVTEAERQRIVEAAQRCFGFTQLLPGQVETMACVLRGEDVLTVLPTGGGKSLCYQLPALLAEAGVTLVISPLIALMKDQLDSLPEALSARATTINSSLEGDELRQRLDQAGEGAYRLLYAAPERLRQPAFLHAVRRAGINYLVVDEAHCVSAWGHDFRPDYLALGRTRAALGNPQLLAMTATAPPRVRKDIIQHLSAPDSEVHVVAGDITRPNLQLEVFHARNQDDKLRRLLAFCSAEEGSGIVYAGTRARCERLAALLNRHGVSATHYHAGIPNRSAVQDDFMAGRVRVVVATVAFGMGIDKPDIRFIVHFAPPPSLEAYYQEAGRAGRDGLPARCLLMYAASDRATLTRRLRLDTLPVEFLRAVYAAIQKRLEGESWGRVAMGDLERDLQTGDVQVRVALSLLEEAALIRRGPDVPRAVQVCLSSSVEGEPSDATLAAFCEAARLHPGRWLTVNLVEVARQAELSLETLELRLLEWSDAGRLACRFSGRDLLLALLPPHRDAAARVSALLERRETVAAQRADEITTYARTKRCRHGYLNAYLGGRLIERCTACDNCVNVAIARADDLPELREQLLSILRCVAAAPWSWGRGSLVHILRADGRAPERARTHEGFGVLAFRSQTAVTALLKQLELGAFLQPRRLDHGGVVLDLTTKGRAALEDPARLDELVNSGQ